CRAPPQTSHTGERASSAARNFASATASRLDRAPWRLSGFLAFLVIFDPRRSSGFLRGRVIVALRFIPRGAQLRENAPSFSARERIVVRFAFTMAQPSFFGGSNLIAPSIRSIARTVSRGTRLIGLRRL